ncbi:eCIS core domain-containing protein [Chromobacterium subtsugae]|uniref:eCIS core domain-containing protein n=1 Tax=Chromobacterium subtsugae TaxID=251747 RepID=UPI001C1076ED|nr:DUF4157 domain-containing protein [Chromobacterium subtsugae]
MEQAQKRTGQMKERVVQGRKVPRNEVLMGRAEDGGVDHGVPGRQRLNQTGLPERLKAGVEYLSGYAMDDVRVHYNSGRPTQLKASAFAQGMEIHIAPGQESLLPHEVWHVVQNLQKRVHVRGVERSGEQVNDDKSLEMEADEMGERSLRKGTEIAISGRHSAGMVLRGVMCGNPGVVQLAEIESGDQPGLRTWLREKQLSGDVECRYGELYFVKGSVQDQFVANEVRGWVRVGQQAQRLPDVMKAYIKFHNLTLGNDGWVRVRIPEKESWNIVDGGVPKKAMNGEVELEVQVLWTGQEGGRAEVKRVQIGTLVTNPVFLKKKGDLRGPVNRVDPTASAVLSTCIEAAREAVQTRADWLGVGTVTQGEVDEGPELDVPEIVNVPTRKAVEDVFGGYGRSYIEGWLRMHRVVEPGLYVDRTAHARVYDRGGLVEPVRIDGRDGDVGEEVESAVRTSPVLKAIGRVYGDKDLKIDDLEIRLRGNEEELDRSFESSSVSEQSEEMEVESGPVSNGTGRSDTSSVPSEEVRERNGGGGSSVLDVEEEDQMSVGSELDDEVALVEVTQVRVRGRYVARQEDGRSEVSGLEDKSDIFSPGV